MYPDRLDGIFFGELYLHEPGGLVTNLMILFAAVWLLIRMRGYRNGWMLKWRLFLGCLGLAAFGGIFTHGFPLLFTEDEFYTVWWLKNSFVPIGNFFAAAAMVPYIFGKTESDFYTPSMRRVLWFFVAKTVLTSVLLFATRSFTPAVLDLAFTWFTVIYAAQMMRKSVPGAGALLIAFLVAVLSGLMYLMPWHLDAQWFTNSDAVHIAVILSMWLVYKGASRAQLHFSAEIGKNSPV